MANKKWKLEILSEEGIKALHEEYKYLQTSKPFKGKESVLLAKIAKFLDWNRHVWNHCPNESKNTDAGYIYLKKQGVKAGFPDVCIFDLQLVVELKTNYNKPTEPQILWLEKMRKLGWKAYWVNSFEEFHALYTDTINSK